MTAAALVLDDAAQTKLASDCFSLLAATGPVEITEADGMATLTAKWGRAKAEDLVEGSQIVYRAMLSKWPTFTAWLVDTGLGSDHRLIELLASARSK